MSDFLQLNEKELSDRWIEATIQYVDGVNALVDRGIATDWEDLGELKEPEDMREPIAEAVLSMVRAASRRGDENIHARFPRAHGPFIKMLKANGQSIPIVRWLDDGRLLIRIGEPYQPGRMFLVADRDLIPLEADVLAVGRSADRKIFAVAKSSGVETIFGWDGGVIARMEWPSSLVGMPGESFGHIRKHPPTITQIIPYNCGKRVMIVSPQGIYVLHEGHVTKLMPTEFDDEYAEETPTIELSMEHAALSFDNRWIACGHQSEGHFVFDAQTLELACEIGHLSEYPHYACFSSDCTTLALNSCHFYQGSTIGVPTNLLPEIVTACHELDPRFTLLERHSRVYSAVSRNDEFIIGDASGYLRAFDFKGKFRWQMFIGSSVGDIDLSADGKKLAVSTYAGFLSVIDLDTGKRDPFQIGTSDHIEMKRYLFWKNEVQPIIW